MQKIIEKFKKHRIVYTILLAPIIVFAGFFLYIIVVFGFINYIDKHQFDSRDEEIAKIIPFSQRGVPPPETDVPVTLPPDPGEAGKLTLAGIDSNNDGVRDDLEREIVYMYPQNDEVRRVLRAMVKKEQDMITTTGDHDHFEALMVSAFAFQNCYEYKVFPIGTFDPTNGRILWQMAGNTTERKKIMRANQDKATPFHSPIYSSSEACTQPLVQGKY